MPNFKFDTLRVTAGGSRGGRGSRSTYSSASLLDISGATSSGRSSACSSGSISPIPIIAISPGDESSESEIETEPARIFHRRVSTKRNINSTAAIKEGFLLKQTWSFQRWRRRYFRLKRNKLYYAKDPKCDVFDEIDLSDLCTAECSIKNVNHSFQTIKNTQMMTFDHHDIYDI
ncbi:diacylglycerol kinase eta-like [Teleopsis dalmanni]|uniref:diacylglycerol kinase eta-like n=1 Tax=Teleopsis dalmanni TaxID=139649 RepID=UPI0018CD8C5D|nr:diacylglycerol kinase eta-like [Teleopsis dalmanni]